MGEKNKYPKLCSHYTGLYIPDFVSVLTLFQHDPISFFRSNVWALCPTGYYLNGIRISGATHLYQIEEAKCCRPHNHPDAYEDCYNENVWGSFDNKGWSECKRDGYYMAGFYKSSCNHLYCLEEFRCCKMKNQGNFFSLIQRIKTGDYV